MADVVSGPPRLMFSHLEKRRGFSAWVCAGVLPTGGEAVLVAGAVYGGRRCVISASTEWFMAFTALSVCLGLAFAACGAALWHGRYPDAGLALRLPRARLAGEVLGLACLVWAAYHGCLMLEGGLAVYRKVVWALVPVTAILVYHHLDYLFARALGGFLVLCAAFFLHGAFAETVPWRPLYCSVCYLMGLWGMFVIAAPWRFRDLLQAMAQATPWRRPLGALAVAAGIILVVLPLLRRMP